MCTLRARQIRCTSYVRFELLPEARADAKIEFLLGVIHDPTPDTHLPAYNTVHDDSIDFLCCLWASRQESICIQVNASPISVFRRLSLQSTVVAYLYLSSYLSPLVASLVRGVDKRRRRNTISPIQRYTPFRAMGGAAGGWHRPSR